MSLTAQATGVDNTSLAPQINTSIPRSNKNKFPPSTPLRYVGEQINTPLILNQDTRWRSVIDYTGPAALLQGKKPIPCPK
jgi:hypothetical protein